MATTDFTSTITVDQTPAEVFHAVTNVRGWWSEGITGETAQLDDVFEYQYEDVHRSKIKLIEVIPNEVVVWHVLENYFSFTEDEKEWTDTKMLFEITKVGDKTQLQMTHIGLVPQCECFEACNDGWTHYIQNSLKSLIETGKGLPNAKGTARTETEKRLTEK
jgi:uncharacterized protein YndB with AHSA1/START domain